MGVAYRWHRRSISYSDSTASFPRTLLASAHASAPPFGTASSLPFLALGNRLMLGSSHKNQNRREGRAKTLEYVRRMRRNIDELLDTNFVRLAAVPALGCSLDVFNSANSSFGVVPACSLLSRVHRAIVSVRLRRLCRTQLSPCRWCLVDASVTLITFKAAQREGGQAL